MGRILVLLAALLKVSLAGPLDLGSKVVGGSIAADGEFPYTVYINYYNRHFCDGSIIHPSWILTAAHCTDELHKSSLFVVAGTNNLDEGGTTYKVNQIVMHPDWDSNSLHNDIALLELRTPIEFNDKIKVIPLERNYVKEGEDSVIIGWGSTVLGGTSSLLLQFLNVKTVTNEKCQEAHPNNEIVESEICTLTVPGEGACHGDSGGPLTRNGKQIGIVSWGHPCAEGYPDVFTRISSFVSWIEIYVDLP